MKVKRHTLICYIIDFAVPRWFLTSLYLQYKTNIKYCLFITDSWNYSGVIKKPSGSVRCRPLTLGNDSLYAVVVLHLCTRCPMLSSATASVIVLCCCHCSPPSLTSSSAAVVDCCLSLSSFVAIIRCCCAHHPLPLSAQ